MKKNITTILIFILVLLAACGSPAYELDKDLSVDFEGYDEYGKVIVSIDKGLVYSNLSEAKKIKDRNAVAELESIIESIEVEAVPNKNLKNGDEVELKLTYKEDNRLDIKFKLKNSKVTVQNLDPLKELTKNDIFEGIDIHFEGISPYLEAIIVQDTSNELSSLFDYTISNSDNKFKIDDEIEVVAQPNSDLIESGYKAAEKDFITTFKVPKQRKYIETWDELNENDQNYILGEIQDFVTAKVDSRIQDDFYSITDKGNYITAGRHIVDSGESVIDETYFLFIKKLELGLFGYHDDVNSLRFIFKNEITFGDVTDDEAYINKTKYYYSMVGASNLIVDENGNLDRNEVDFSLFSIPDLDKNTIINEAINSIKDKYNVNNFEMNEE